MKILLVGGGSGGHVTPLKAVIDKLPAEDIDEIYLITDRKFYGQTLALLEDNDSVKIKKIFAGKYRRYHGKSFMWHITHLPTLLYNLRDIFYLSLGFIQSFIHIMLHRPDVVCAKGGFVSLPVGLVSRIFNIPLVIHDSDTHPGLTSRVLSRWALVIATGMPAKYYPYPRDKMTYIGIPVDERYKPISSKQRRGEKKGIGFDEDRPLLLVTGGGTGANRLNEFISSQARELIENGWSIVLITGSGKSKQAKKRHSEMDTKISKYWQIHEFVDLTPFVLAADIVVTRAGASAMQEFANSKKTVVVVPSPVLSGGHQVKNAKMFSEAKAASYIKESDLISGKTSIVDAVKGLVNGVGDDMAENLHKGFARPKAAEQFAKVIIDAARR